MNRDKWRESYMMELNGMKRVGRGVLYDMLLFSHVTLFSRGLLLLPLRWRSLQSANCPVSIYCCT
jgi:hypothetical protein